MRIRGPDFWCFIRRLPLRNAKLLREWESVILRESSLSVCPASCCHTTNYAHCLTMGVLF